MTFLEKTLFTRNTTTPKSYVVGFKYVGDTFSGVIYNGRIYSNAQVHFRCIIIRGLSLETVGSKEKTVYHILNKELPLKQSFKVNFLDYTYSIYL